MIDCAKEVCPYITSSDVSHFNVEKIDSNYIGNTSECLAEQEKHRLQNSRFSLNRRKRGPSLAREPHSRGV